MNDNPEWLTLVAWRAEIEILTADPRMLGPAGRLLREAFERSTIGPWEAT